VNQAFKLLGRFRLNLKLHPTIDFDFL